MAGCSLPERRRALRVARFCRNGLWGAVAFEVAAAVMMAVVYSKAAAFFLFAAVFIAAFNILTLGPIVRASSEAIDRDEQRQARLDRLYTDGSDA